MLGLVGAGIDGQGDMKLICGIKIAGMNRKTRKDDKVPYQDSCSLAWDQIIIYRLIMKIILILEYMI